MLLMQSLFSIVFCNLVVHYSYAQSLPSRSNSPESVLNTIFDVNNDNSQEKKWIESQEATDKLYISSKIRYRYSITEVFSKTINRNGNQSREVKFQMALPEAAFISKFIIEVDGVSYKALVKEKQVAKQEYETAKIKGQTAGLIEVKETNILEISLTVEPNNTVNFNLTYEEFLLRKLGYYEHHIYINPSQLENSTDYRVKVDILESQNLTTIVIPDLQNSVNFKPQGELSKNASILRPTGNRAIIEWTPTFAERNKYMEEGMLGQFLVRYDIKRESDVGEVLLMNGYFVHFFAPPNVLPLRKHVIFILDTSGSMWGRRIQQLKEVMGTVIDDLKPDDYFNIITFSETSTSWSPANEQPQIIPFPTTEINLRQAHIYIKKLEADKGTNIYSAIMDGLEVASVGKDKLPDNVESLILFLTDGEPTVGVKNCDTIRKDIKAKNNESVPIYSIALGTGADFTFLKELSLENNGFGRKIYESGDAAIQIRGFYKEISSPLLSNVTFKYTSQGDNKIQKISKRNFLKAFSGGEIAVVGTFVEKRKDEIIANISFESNSIEEYPTSPPIFIVEINANGRDGHIMLKSNDVLYTIDAAYSFPSNISHASTNKTLPTAEPGHPEENNFLERLWAYLTVKQLLDIHPTEEHLDDYEYMLESNEVLDADQPTSSPIPELPKSNESSADRALRLSLKYGFVTPVTSLVVVKPDLKSGNIRQESAKLMKASLTDTVSPASSSPSQMHHQNLPSTPTINRNVHSSIESGEIYSSGGGRGIITGGSIRYRAKIFGTRRNSRRRRPLYRQTTKVDTKLRKLHNLSAIRWLDRNATSVTVNGKIYTLKKSEQPVPVPVYYYPCKNNPATSTKVNGNCYHLEDCVLKRITKKNNKLKYASRYFCPLEDEDGEQFAGICCPDGAWI